MVWFFTGNVSWAWNMEKFEFLRFFVFAFVVFYVKCEDAYFSCVGMAFLLLFLD